MLNPKHTDAAISLSVIYNDIGKYDDAKKFIKSQTKRFKLKKPGNDFLLDRKFSIKHIELGDLYFKFHRYDEALDDYSKAQQLDPNQTLTRIKIAKVYAKKGFVSRAIQELQQLCIENETDVEARVQLGLMHFSQGNVIDAQIEWEKAREIEPADKEVSTYLSMARQATETSL